MTNEFIVKNGFIPKGDGQVDNNLNVIGDVAGNKCTGVGSPFIWSATAEYIRVSNAA